MKESPFRFLSLGYSFQAMVFALAIRSLECFLSGLFQLGSLRFLIYSRHSVALSCISCGFGLLVPH